MMKRFFQTLRQFAFAAVVSVATLALAFEGVAEAKFSYPTNHPDLQWMSIETEHFVVHYPVSKRNPNNKHYFSTEWAGRKVAKVAEEMWPKMCAHFNYYLKERIHIVLLNQADDLAGFTIPPWDWIEISANPGYDFYRMRGRMEWFSDVLVHEFAHVVSLKSAAVMSEGTQGVSTGGLLEDGINDVDTGVNLPIAAGEDEFWVEGGAEYYSDDTGYNWWTASRDMNIRMTVLQDRLLTYKEWDAQAGKWGWGDGERYYQQGDSFALYLRERFGSDTYARFGQEFAKGWRPDFDSVIQDVLGVSEEQLYNDWVAYLKQKYNAQYDRVKARGEVVGMDINAYDKPWLYTDPAGRDAWLTSKSKTDPDKDTNKKYKRERRQQATGTWSLEPRVSDDGRFIGFENPVGYGNNIRVSRWDERTERAFSGQDPTDPALQDEMKHKSTGFTQVTGSGWDFVPGRDAVVVAGTEDDKPRFDPLHWRLEADGYNWNQIQIWDFATRTEKEGNREVDTYKRKKFIKQEQVPKGSFHPVPNTLRGSDPTMSPDGKRIAYFEYNDGGMNLVVIDIDGNNKKYVTNWHDGTWLQRADWSPDGTKIVLAVFRNYQQNLYIADPATNVVEPIMQDSWEEMDAHWAKDGNIYFAADCDSIWNIYKYDPRTRHFWQLTNVIGGAQDPYVTPEGNLLYVYYTAFGWKIHGLAQDEFMNAPADHNFNTDFDGAVVKTALATSEDLSSYAGQTSEYRVPKSIMAPTGAPLLRLENDGGPNWGLQGGFYIFAQDYVEKNSFFGLTYLGDDSLVFGEYNFQGFWPTLGLDAYVYQGKDGDGFIVDVDNDPSTTTSDELYERKQPYQVANAEPFITYPWNDRLDVDFRVQFFEYLIKQITDVQFEPYMQRVEPQLAWEFNTIAFASNSPNPPRGRDVGLQLAHGFTDIVFKDYGGSVVDDGQVFDQYQFNRVELRWTEQMDIPTFGGVPILSKARAMQHRLQLDLRLGYVDRNVTSNDEMHAGGQHPYQYGFDALTPNTLFSGYPAFSLSGETLGILNLAYRFPLMHQWQFHKAGPLAMASYSNVQGIWMQIGGSAGNLWSFRPPSQSSGNFYVDQYDQYVAYDPDTIKREIPFVDKAYKNGNYLLYDAQAEIRVPIIAFNTVPWDSFFRVAYGFNDITGYGDVNGDSFYNGSDSGNGDGLSNEVEQAGFRFYIGLGTGW